jgi:hypothetical protein
LYLQKSISLFKVLEQAFKVLGMEVLLSAGSEEHLRLSTTETIF